MNIQINKQRYSYDEYQQPLELDQVRKEIYARLVRSLDAEFSGVEENLAELQEEIDFLIEELESEYGIELEAAEKSHIVSVILDELRGTGPLAALLADSEVSDILINGPKDIWVDRGGCLTKTVIQFDDTQHITRFLNRILAFQGKTIDHSSPIVDAKLEDGSRLHALMPPLCSNGPVVSIRKFTSHSCDLGDLVSQGFMSDAMLELLRVAVAGRVNVIISGGAASGKTTLMNALSQYVSEDERVVTIEESTELKLAHKHVVSLEGRSANSEGEGAIGLQDLLKAALRMRADRIMIGEIRGAEVFDMLQAMNVGHDGSMATVHANSPEDAIRRLETLAMIHGNSLSVEFVQALIGSAVQIVVQLTRRNDGSRYVESIAQVALEKGELQVTRLFCRQQNALKKGDERHSYTGEPIVFLQNAKSRGVNTAQLKQLLAGEQCHA